MLQLVGTIVNLCNLAANVQGQRCSIVAKYHLVVKLNNYIHADQSKKTLKPYILQ